MQEGNSNGRVAALGFGLAGAMALTIIASLAVGMAPIYLAMVGFVLVVVVFALSNLTFAVSAFLAYVAMEGMFKYATGFSQVVYVIRPILALLIFFSWCAWRHTRAVRRLNPPMIGLLIALMVWGVVQLFQPMGGGLAQGVATLLLWYVTPILFYFLSFNIFTSQSQIERLLWTVVFTSTIVSAFAVLQFSMGREWTFAHVPGYDNLKGLEWTITQADGAVKVGSFRPASTAAQGGAGSVWSHLGAIFALALMVMPRTANSNAHKAGLVVCLLINILGMLVGGARVFVVLSLLEILLFLILTARSARDLGRNIGVLAVLAGISAFGFNLAQTISGNILLERYGKTLSNPLSKFQQDRGGSLALLPGFVAQHPLGVGYQRGFGGGEDRGEVTSVGAIDRENQFTAIAADMGVPGVIMACALLIGFLVHGWRAYWRLQDPGLRVLGGMILAYMGGINAAALGTPIFQSNELLWILFGILVALPRIERRERENARAASRRDVFLGATSKAPPLLRTNRI